MGLNLQVRNRMSKRRIARFIVETVLLIVFVCGILGIEARSGGASSDNLTLNGGFEILVRARWAWAEDLKPEAWKESREGGWGIDLVDSQRGNNSLKATTAWSWFSQEIKVEPERYYLLQTYVRSDITIPEKEDYDNTFLAIECLDWRKKVIKRDWGIVNATSSWQLKENLIFTPPGTRKIRIKLAKRQGDGSVWFDGVKVINVSSGLILNPGFEILNEVGKPHFWKEHPQGGWEVSGEEVYEGNWAMRATQGWSWLSQEVPVKAKRWYSLAVQVKSDITLEERTDYENTFLTIECLDEEGEAIKRQWGNAYAFAFPLWHERENVIYTPENTRKIRIKLAKRLGDGSVWFDDVKLTERLFLPGKLPDKLTPLFTGLMYFLLVFSFVTVVIKIRSRKKSGRDR